MDQNSCVVKSAGSEYVPQVAASEEIASYNHSEDSSEKDQFL